MRVSFAWVTPSDQLIPEGETDGHLAELRELQDGQRWQLGLLELAGDGDAAPVCLADPLPNLIQQACLDGVTALAAEGEHVIRPYESEGEIRLKVDGDDVLLSAGTEPSRRFPRAELLPALVDCAARYLAAVRRIHAGDAVWDKRLARLDQLLASARAALAGKPA